LVRRKEVGGRRRREGRTREGWSVKKGSTADQGRTGERKERKGKEGTRLTRFCRSKVYSIPWQAGRSSSLFLRLYPVYR
jgi:hypothetical protein